MSKRERKSQNKKKDVKPIFRIYTEGEKTEINYIIGYIRDYLNQKGYLKGNIKLTQPPDFSPSDDSF